MSNESKTVDTGLNRAKMYQLALFPMNNGATNVYFVLILSYIATFGNTVLAIATLFAAFAASSACFWWTYQPEEPETLQDK